MGLIDPEMATSEDRGTMIFWSVIKSEGEIALYPNEAASLQDAQSQLAQYIEEVKDDSSYEDFGTDMHVEIIRTFDREESNKLAGILENDLPRLGCFIEFMLHLNDKEVDPHTYDFIAGASEFVQLSNAQQA